MREVTVKKNGRKSWKALLALSRSEKTRGLMFRKKAFPLLFDFGSEGTLKNAIHSFFCPPFDAIFMNSEKKVVFVFESVPPFKPLVYSRVPARFLLELQPGEGRKLKNGDKLDW